MVKRLTQEMLKELFYYDSESGILTWKKRGSHLFKNGKNCDWWNNKFAGKEVGTIRNNSASNKPYKHVRVFYKSYRVHKLIWLMVYGEMPDQIDHANGNGCDNRLKNLRNVTHGENAKNIKKRIDNKSGVTGVCWNKEKKRWHVQVNSNKKRVYSKYFKSKQDAINARIEASKSYGFHSNHGTERAL